MAAEKITAETRTEFGKGAARRIRREDKIPAVVYGHGNEPIHVTLPGHDTMMALKHGGANALLELDIDGNDPAGADQAGPDRPDPPRPRAHRLRRRRQGREGHRRRARPPRRRGRPRDPGRHREPRPSSSRPRPPTSPSTSRSTSRALQAGTQILASRPRAARGLDAADRPRDADRQRHPGADRRGARGRAGRGRGRGRHRARRESDEEAAEAAEGDAAEGGDGAPPRAADEA